MNLITLALIGTITERRLGARRWAALFIAGTTGGQAAAFTWHLPGGGYSIGICGLAGGLSIWLLTKEPDRKEVTILACYVAALTGWGLGGVRGAAAAVLIAAAVSWTTPARIGLLSTTACALTLTITQDLHGVALLSGMVVVTLFRRHTTKNEVRVRDEGGTSRRVA